jgi:hypothetical protein
VAWGIYGSLRFGRLCHFLRQLVPDEQIGHTILIYKLSEKDLRSAIDLPISEDLPMRNNAVFQR